MEKGIRTPIYWYIWAGYSKLHIVADCGISRKKNSGKDFLTLPSGHVKWIGICLVILAFVGLLICPEIDRNSDINPAILKT